MGPGTTKKDRGSISPQLGSSHKPESEKGFSAMSLNAVTLGPSWGSQLSVMLYKNYLFLVSSYQL